MLHRAACAGSAAYECSRIVSKITLQVLVLTLFTYSFFCGQSGTSFYEDIVRNSFNIVLALPIICVGVFDQDVSWVLILLCYSAV